MSQNATGEMDEPELTIEDVRPVMEEAAKYSGTTPSVRLNISYAMQTRKSSTVN